MKKYNQPMMEMIPVSYGEIATDLIGSSVGSGNSIPSISFDDIILGGHYSEQKMTP